MTGTSARLFPLFIVFLLLQVSAFASEKSVKPTFAKESSSQVPRGGAVQITLESVPDYGNPIHFEIKEQPLHGSLSNLTNDSDHTATVLYHHDGGKTPLSDEFSFRAQAPGHAKSAVCKVSITVIPPPANLVIEPKAVDFGPLMLDQKRQTNVFIRNLGGTSVSGSLILPPGYSAPAGTAFSLNEGDSSNVLVVFQPEEERDYSAIATLSAECPKETLVLKGSGLPRFEVTKTGRLGGLVKNLSDQSIQISFNGNSAWIMPPGTTIPPRGEKPFLFQELEQEGVPTTESQSSEVHISDGLGTSDFELPPPHGFIPLTVSAEPSSPLGSDLSTSLGNIPLGASVPVKFSILNRSQDSKHALWSAISSSGGGMKDPIPLNLNGGEAREMRFDWKPTQPGAATLKISVDEGTKTHHELFWHTLVTTDSVTTLSQESSASQPVASSESVEESSNQNGPREAPKTSSIIPPLDQLSWKIKSSWFRKPVLIITCETKQGENSQFQIKEQLLRVLGGYNPSDKSGDAGISPFSLEFISLESTREKREGDLEVLRLKPLSPGWHLLVVTRISADGSVDAQSQLKIFIPQDHSRWNRWRLPLGCLGILLLFSFLKYQRDS